jgi:hypothetical protein
MIQSKILNCTAIPMQHPVIRQVAQGVVRSHLIIQCLPHLLLK